MKLRSLLPLACCCLLMACMVIPALAEPLPVATYAAQGEVKRTYDSDTLKVSLERFENDTILYYITKIWMADPGRQIKKATAPWRKKLHFPSDMAKKIDAPVVVINGSGYVSPVFPWIPENYPGVSKDYHYSPLGSLTITNGETFRNLAGVPYYGLTLEADGLHMHVDADNETVLAGNPTQTWSFYTRCPLIQHGESILDRTWDFANQPNIRNIICKKDQNNYVVLTVTHKRSAGWTLLQCVDYLLDAIGPEWAYNLDGGPSAALLFRDRGSKKLRTIYGNNSKDTDIMAFVEAGE